MVEENTRLRRVRKIIILIVLLLIMLAIGATILYQWPRIYDYIEDRRARSQAKEIEIEDINRATGAHYLPLDDILVTLTHNGESTFVTLSITLELYSTTHRGEIARLGPEIYNQTVTYVRELGPNELQGSAAIYRLREELLYRYNKITQPYPVRDVLFLKILVQ